MGAQPFRHGTASPEHHTARFERNAGTAHHHRAIGLLQAHAHGAYRVQVMADLLAIELAGARNAQRAGNVLLILFQASAATRLVLQEQNVAHLAEAQI